MTSRFYVPTCTTAADAFYALGEPLRVNACPNRDMALARAREIATRHGGDPVVLCFDTPFSALAGSDAFLPMLVDPEEAAVDHVEFRSSVRARLGYEETALIEAVVEGLKEAVKFAADVTKFGQGEGNVDINDLVPQSVKEKYEEYKAKREKEKRAAELKKKIGNAKKKAANSTHKAGPNAQKQRQKLLRPGVKSAKAPKAAKQATQPKQARKAKQATQAQPAMQGPKPSKGTPPVPHKGEKTASKTIQVDGVVDGKPVKAVIRKGTKYKIVRGPGGKVLHRKGQKPMVIKGGAPGL